MRYDWPEKAYDKIHPDLWLRYAFDSASQSAESKEAHLNELVSLAKEQAKDDFYRLAFEQWKQALESQSGHLSASFQTQHRLLTGLGNASVLETWVSLNPLFGLPMLRGEALKGAARAEAMQRLESLGEPDRKRWEGYIQILFGGENGAGLLNIHDAWWVPGSHKSPLVREVETPHHSQYYSSHGAIAASDFDKPIPIAQVAVQGAFLVFLEIPEEYLDWGEFTMKVLDKALAGTGYGARISVGYGKLIR